MAQSKHEIQEILAAAEMQPRHRFGQNFMIDQNLVKVVAEAGTIEPTDLIVEVGPGTGTLTDELLERGADVLAVEIDRDLAEALRQRLAGQERFRLIEGDALASKHRLNSELAEAITAARAAGRTVKLIANLPYNIASPLVIELLLAGVQTLVFVVQKEVAERLGGTPGGDDYGPLTVMAQSLAAVEFLRKLPAAAFWPAPQVESALVRITRQDQLGNQAHPFHDFIHGLFSARRKTLRKALSQMGLDAEQILAGTGIRPQQRAEELPPGQLLAMFGRVQGGPTR